MKLVPLLLLAVSLPAFGAADFPCANEIRQELGAEALEAHYPMIRAIAILSQTPEYPNSEALGRWQEVRGYVTNRTDLNSYPKLRVSCDDQNLYPTHPQQILKEYHRYSSNQYNNTKLKGGDGPCLMAANTSGPKGPSCLRADLAYDVIISDTYQDACGNYYRGFRQTAFLGKEESMGTLFSAGRTVFQRPGSTIENDMTYGHTYPVAASEMLMVGPLLPGDAEAIERARKEAAATNVYDEATRTYRQR